VENGGWMQVKVVRCGGEGTEGSGEGGAQFGTAIVELGLRHHASVADSKRQYSTAVACSSSFVYF
jgi:hypothetical protein